MTELTAEQQAAMEAQLMGDDPEAAQEAAEWLEANGYEIDYSALEGDHYQPPSEDEALAQAVRGELGEDARTEALEAAGIPIAEEEPVDPSLLQEMAEGQQAELDGGEWDDDFEGTRLAEFEEQEQLIEAEEAEAAVKEFEQALGRRTTLAERERIASAIGEDVPTADELSDMYLDEFKNADPDETRKGLSLQAAEEAVQREKEREPPPEKEIPPTPETQEELMAESHDDHLARMVAAADRAVAGEEVAA